MLRIHNIIFDMDEGEEPLPPTVQPPARRTTLLEALATTPETVVYTGTAGSYPVRLASSETMGFIPTEKRDALMALYLESGTFEVETDLMGNHGDPRIYNGVRFDPTAGPPLFAWSGLTDLWLFDLPLRVPYAPPIP